MGKATCAVVTCDREAKQSIYCYGHYNRLRRTGRLDVHIPLRPHRNQSCSVSGCDQPYRGHGYCSLHYSRWYRWGDPLAVHPRAKTGEDHPDWLGDKAGYFTIHQRISKQRGKARQFQCMGCAKPAEDWAYDHSDPNEIPGTNRHPAYSPDIYRYQPMCRACHKALDNSVRNQQKAG